MTAARVELKLGKKALPSKKLLYALGAIVVLVLALKVLPGLLGGGGGVAPLRSGAVLHLHKAAGASSSAGASTKPLARPSRDPFGAPPGYAAIH